MRQMVLGDFANGYGETIQRLSGIHAGNRRPRRPAAASVFKIAAERVYFVEADPGLLDCALRYSRLESSTLRVDHRFNVSIDIGLRRLGQESQQLGRIALGEFFQALDFISEEQTSESQSLMRHSYAVICLKNKHNRQHTNTKL